MNDLIRPSLYQSHHEIIPLRRNPLGTILADVVGLVCESGDFLARADGACRMCFRAIIWRCVRLGLTDLCRHRITTRGLRPAEVMVDGGSWSVMRKRETLEDLVRGE